MMKRFKRLIAWRTSSLRYSIVKLICPTLIGAYDEYCALLGRPMVLFLKVRFQDKPLTGAEIGVAAGANSELMLRILNLKKLYLIDPYQPYTDWGNRFLTTYASSYVEAKNRLAKYEDKTVFLLKTSMEALNFVPNSLDFVYIDGNHSYEYVRNDIVYYYQKVVKGGVLGGHDYAVTDVEKAVTEFAKEHNLLVHRQLRDWWVIKD